MTNCNTCGYGTNDHGCCQTCEGEYVPYRSSPPIARACELVHLLFTGIGITGKLPEDEICKRLELECHLTRGKYHIPALSLLVASRLLQELSAQSALRGDFQSLTVSNYGSNGARELRLLAKEWKKDAISANDEFKFGVVRNGRSSLGLKPYRYYNTYKKYSHTVKPIAIDRMRLTCDFNCCDRETEEQVVLDPITGLPTVDPITGEEITETVIIQDHPERSNYNHAPSPDQPAYTHLHGRGGDFS